MGPTTRARHRRAGLYDGSDLTDKKWALPEPLLPVPRGCERPRRWPLREIMNAIIHVLRCCIRYGSLAATMLELDRWRAGE